MLRFSFRPAFSLRGRGFFGLRGWDGAPTHPMVVHFPIAAYLLAAAFAIVSEVGRGQPWGHDAFVAGIWVMAGGFLGSLVAATTGVLDWLTVDRGSQVGRTANAHGLVMVITTVLVIVDLIIAFGRYGAPAPGIALTLLTVVIAVLVTAGAGLGGALVYDYGFRVRNSTSTPEWEPSDEDRLPDGTVLPSRGGRQPAG
ncbi:MAG TPA: DUF2231 domain-containing protein [Candidatus Dormibacteraeota bacterium]|nr:DUF2231 domain-containing protein [Candidatus Dormibacteraeota bacterium]